MAMLEATGPVEPAAVGDWLTRRTRIEATMAALGAQWPAQPDVTGTAFTAEADDGTPIALRWYTRADGASGPGVVYLHGGGMILGSVSLYEATIMRYVASSGVPMLAVDYRVAPEHPQLTPVSDCYAGLCWLAEHATELGVDPTRIGVMGDSAGGGLAAGVALLARDRGGPALAKQILVYPMLDDRTTTPDPHLLPFATWTYDDNVTGWEALLGASAGGKDVSPYAAPARVQDPAGLAPAYIEVGALDIFRDECVEYARRLSAGGVGTELHLHPGVPHAFEAFAPDADVSRRSAADRIRALRDL